MIVVLGSDVFTDEHDTVAVARGEGMVLMPTRPLMELNCVSLSQIIGLLIEEMNRKETGNGSNEESETV